MYLKRITTLNIQNHRQVTIDLPPTGLVVFTGDNSNGKSVIVKTTRILLSGQLNKPRKRSAIVNRKATFGEISYTRSDDVTLTAHIAREAAATYVKLCIPNEEPVVRYLADKNYMELVQQFGWHYDKTSGISLNIAEEEDALLFYKTSNKINGQIIETATNDSVANKTAEMFEKTIKDARSFRESYITEIRTYTNACQGLHVEDIQPLEELKGKLEYYHRNLSKVYFPQLPEIQAVPTVHYVDLYVPTLPTIIYPKILDISCELPDIVPLMMELEDLRNNVCPLCGRGFDCEC